MGHTIIVDDEVFAKLQSLAVPLVDDANSVLRRVLGVEDKHSATNPATTPSSTDGPRREAHPTDSSGSGSKGAGAAKAAGASQGKGNAKRTKKAKRAPKGSLLPETEYEVPLLESLEELGGSAATSEVVELLGKKLEPKFTDVDRETINSGEVRWRNRVQFVRLGLIKEGLMSKDSPRGIWELTDAGRARLERTGASL